MGGGGLHPAGLIGFHHGVHYGDGVAVGIGDQLVGTIVRFAVSVLVHAVDGLRRVVGPLLPFVDLRGFILHTHIIPK